MGSCCGKSSAKKHGLETTVSAATGTSFPVVITNPCSTGAISSPSTCSTVSTTSISDCNDIDEDECKEDGTGMPPHVARLMLARMAVAWKRRRFADTQEPDSTTNPKGDHQATPRPALRPVSSSTVDDSDSDPWNVVEGDL